jgi:hypothetical protein
VSEFAKGQRVRILADPEHPDDPPKGTLATVTMPHIATVTVTFPGGEAVYFDSELAAAA